MQRYSLLFGLALFAPAAACGDGDDPDAGPAYERPQILPNLSPICLTPSYIPGYTRVGQTKTQPIQLLNFGAQTLAISSAEFVNASSNVFTVQGVSPMSIEYTDQAIAQLLYSPTTAGWDYATLKILSNAENYPNLQIFTLGLAIPADIDAGSEAQWDAGPKPDAAYGMVNGVPVEICRVDSGV